MELSLEDFHQFHGKKLLSFNKNQVLDKALFFLFKMEEIFKNLDALKKKKKFTTLKISCFHLGQWI
jgi:hypothetical protein